MVPKIYCLHDLHSPPKEFTATKKSGDSYVCTVDCLEDSTQLLFFTHGLWCKDSCNAEIQIFLSVKDLEIEEDRKLCSLSEKQRSFVWSSEDHHSVQFSFKQPKTFYARVTGRWAGYLTDQQLSSPVHAKLSEGEIMKLTNETTPTAPPKKTEIEEVIGITTENSSSSQSPLRKKQKKGDDKVASVSNKTTRSKKRPLDKENLCVTPKLKSSRGRAASKISNNKNTPPSKQSLLSDLSQKDAISPMVDESKNVCCVSLPTREPKPSSRWGHTVCMIDNHNAILIGGQGDKMQLSKDSIWQLDTESRAWKSLTVTTEGIKPENRMGHSATYDQTVRCIYVYGGSKNSKWFHDVHMYDLDEQKWTLVKANGKAPTRAYHSATLYRHELWIFGGVFPRPVPQPDGCDNELHIFSPVMEGWYKPIVTGEKPAARSGHAANLVDDRLVVFGGWDFPFCYSDIHILDLTTLDWSSPKVIGEAPKPRCWSSSCTLTNRRVFIQGGYDGDNPLNDGFIFDLDKLMWQKLSIDKAPSPRAGHAGICLYSRYDNENEDEILVFGGGDNDGTFFNDMYSFYIPFIPAISH